MMIFNSIIYFIITIAILVFIHEFGHFIAAKISKMRVDSFAIGFGQRLFGWNKKTGFTFWSLPKDIQLDGNTDYRLNLLPLGGYVKIAGMIDESMDKEFLNKAPEPWEFRSSTMGKKLFVISAGVILNLLLAFLIFWGINFFRGKQHIKTTEVGYVVNSSAAEKAGFKQSDKILAIDNNPVQYWDEIYNNIFIKKIGEDLNFQIERNGTKTNLIVKRSSIPNEEKDMRTFLLPKGVKPAIFQVMGNTPAQKAGFKEGDIFISINKTETVTDQQVISQIKSNPLKELTINVLRMKSEQIKDTVSIAVTPGKDGTIGISLGNIFDAPIEYKSFGIFESGIESFKDCWSNVTLFFDVIKKVISGKVEFSKAFGGPVRIAQMAGKTADAGMISFLSFLALLSLSLGIINILPFPVLDGGHLIIILIEGIIKREISPKIKIAVQNVGFAILLLFMAYVIYSDFLHI